MLRYILIRLATFIPVLLAIITITFFMVRIAPGGPFDADRRVPEETLRQLQAAYNLDAPLYRQYFDYVGSILQGDLGPSFKKPSRTVREWILLRLPVSLELGAYALLVALGIGLPAGILAAARPNSLQDYGPMSLAMAGICMPNFVLGPATAGMLTGSFVVEKIFQVPGLGREFVEAAFNRDYTMIMGTVLVYATMVLLLNLLADVLQAWLDPRVRVGAS